MSEVIEETRARYAIKQKLAGGKRRLRVSARPLGYLRNGEWREYNLADRDDDAEPTKFRMIDGGDFTLRVSKDRMGYRYDSDGGSWVSVELVGIDGQSVTAPTPERQGRWFGWRDIVPDTDLAMQAKVLGIETRLYVRSASAPKNWTWRVLGDLTMIRPFIGWDANRNKAEISYKRNGNLFTITWTGFCRDPQGNQVAPAYPVIIDPDVDETAVALGGSAGNGATWEYSDYFLCGQQRGTDLYGYARFTTVALPQGCTIDSADFNMTPLGEYANGTADVNFQAEDEDNPGTIAGPQSIGTLTTATANLSWTTTGGEGWPGGVDVTSVIQEIVNRGGWSSGNSINIVGTDAGGGTTNGYEWFISPALDITYSLASGGSRSHGYIIG